MIIGTGRPKILSPSGIGFPRYPYAMVALEEAFSNT